MEFKRVKITIIFLAVLVGLINIVSGILNISIAYPKTGDYEYSIVSLNYTVSADATTCMYYNGTSNATITCGVNLTNLVSGEISKDLKTYF